MSKLKEHIFIFLNFLLIIKLIKTDKISIDIPEDSQQQSVTTCLVRILNRTYVNTLESGTVATLLNTESQNQSSRILFRKIYYEYKWAVLNLRSKINYEILVPSTEINNYLIQIRGVEEIKEDLLRLKYKYWNPRAKLILYAEKNFNVDDIKLHVFKTLWEQKALDSIILLPRVKNNTIFDIYTWFPYNNSNCGTYNEAYLVNVCHNGHFQIKNETSFFPNKIPKKLNGCPVKVRTVIWPPYVISPSNLNPNETARINFTKGLEIELLNTIAKALNITLIYSVSKKTEDWGLILENGTATGIFKTLLKNHVDMALGSLAATTNRFLHFEPSVPYGTESLTWCVPSASLQPKWLNIFNVYEVTTYVFMFSSFLIISFTTYLLSKIINDIPAYKNIGESFLNLYAAFLGLSLRLKPKYSSPRITFFACAFLNLIIGAVYQTTLITFIANPMFERQTTTVEHIFENKLDILYMPQTKMYYSWDTIDWRMQKVLNNMSPCPDAYECINAIALKRNASIAIPRLFLLHILDKLVTEDGRLLVYWFKEDMISFPIQIFMTKGFPLAQSINHYIVQILQTGIMDKLQQDLQQKLNEKSKNINQQKNNDARFNLNLEQLYGAFYVLFVGLFISSLVFVGELIFYKHSNKKITFIH